MNSVVTNGLVEVILTDNLDDAETGIATWQTYRYMILACIYLGEAPGLSPRKFNFKQKARVKAIAPPEENC